MGCYRFQEWILVRQVDSSWPGTTPHPPVCVSGAGGGVKGLSADVIPGADQGGCEAYEQKLLLRKASHGEAAKRPEVRDREPRKKIHYICDGI